MKAFSDIACVSYAHKHKAPWTLYSEGYRRASLLLIENARSLEHSQDFLVYPILNMFFHSIEISIKGMLFCLGEKPASTHKLSEQLGHLKKTVSEKIGWEETGWEPVDKAVEYLEQIPFPDQMFRYPVDRKMNRHFKEIDYVYLDEIHTLILSCHVALNAAETGCSAEMDAFYDSLEAMS
jgi:hypothetical protein